jgi:hypothetical protein
MTGGAEGGRGLEEEVRGGACGGSRLEDYAWNYA